jgi:dienelactone hydrolase
MNARPTRRIDECAVLRTRSLFGAIGAVALFVLMAGAPPARAQLWLAEAFPSHWLRGPERAAGAVIWSHGRSMDSEDSDVEVPPYLETLRDGGWDAFRYNRMRASDTLDASARGLAGEVHRLKQQGYRRIALAGQSFGAFVSLIAADSSEEVDAVIATAPAAYGSFSDYYEGWRSNATKLYPLMERVRRARVMVFYFHGDDFDPGGRGERTRAILAARKLPHVVIDQPPLLTSHWAAGSEAFATTFGACILGFLDAPDIVDGAHCEGQDFRQGPSAVVERGPDSGAPVATHGSGRRHMARN